MDECRKQFEELMGAPPYEVNLRRYTEESAWPGNYRDYKVQLAWCAWEELWNRRAETQVPEGWKDVAVELPKDGQLIIGCNKDYGTWTEVWDSEESVGATRWWIAAPEVKP